MLIQSIAVSSPKTHPASLRREENMAELSLCFDDDESTPSLSADGEALQRTTTVRRALLSALAVLADGIDLVDASIIVWSLCRVKLCRRWRKAGDMFASRVCALWVHTCSLLALFSFQPCSRALGASRGNQVLSQGRALCLICSWDLGGYLCWGSHQVHRRPEQRWWRSSR